jgi:hypothetical protein
VARDALHQFQQADIALVQMLDVLGRERQAAQRGTQANSSMVGGGLASVMSLPSEQKMQTTCRLICGPSARLELHQRLPHRLFRLVAQHDLEWGVEARHNEQAETEGHGEERDSDTRSAAVSGMDGGVVSLA